MLKAKVEYVLQDSKPEQWEEWWRYLILEEGDQGRVKIFGTQIY
jgi:hypothetical protein